VIGRLVDTQEPIDSTISSAPMVTEDAHSAIEARITRASQRAPAVAPTIPPTIMATTTGTALGNGACPPSSQRDIAAITTATKLMARFRGDRLPECLAE
jgi:hypothetical protein